MKKILPIIVRLVIIILLITSITFNIIYIKKYNKIKNETTIETIIKREKNVDYNEKKTYYSKLNFKQFNNKINSDKPSTIAIVDKKTKTYHKYLELINKISFYNDIDLYLLDISDLSKKNLINFYEIDDKLKEYEDNYIIIVKSGKIISTTTFNEEDIGTITEKIK